MIKAPITMAIAVPSVPAFGRKVVPGIINAPQPIMQPNARAHTLSGLRPRDNLLLSFPVI